jgi:ADP-ribosylation factor-like protein 2
MGLLTILKKQKQKEREVRLLMLGLDNAGKTTVVKKFNGEDIDLISPTLGFNIQTLEYRGFKLNIWDVGGQTSLRSYWRNYFEQTDGLIWVVDSADRARLRDCRAEFETLLQQERLAGASLLVFANKQDIAGALTAEEIRKVGLPIFLCSSERRDCVSLAARHFISNVDRAPNPWAGARPGQHSEATLAHRGMQRLHRSRPGEWGRLDRPGHRIAYIHA